MLRPMPAAPGEESLHDLKLEDGSRVAVIGGAPAGSFFSYFLLQTAQRMGLDLQVDIYEPRDFSLPAPQGCNMCGGIISESLVQALTVEGINLPTTVVQRGIDSYVLHMEEGSVRIDTPLHEKRIAAVHRGSGPRTIKEKKWRSLDGFLLELATEKGARVARERVDGIAWQDGKPQVKTRGGLSQTYDLLAVGTGVNSGTLKIFEELRLGYKAPQTAKTYIRELYLGREMIEKHLGSAMHVFLLNMPRLEFAALIPKGDYVTLVLLGEIDAALVEAFLAAPAVSRCLPLNWRELKEFCHCSPKINIQSAVQPFADRLVFIGDAGVTRLYKDGIGAAYRTAKAAALTAVFDGVSSEDFRRRYWPVCRSISTDNALGKLIFLVTRHIQRWPHDRRGVLRMVSKEQQGDGQRRMSMVLWDIFTGSAPYKDILLRTLHPAFLAGLVWSVAVDYWDKTINGGSHGNGRVGQNVP